LSADQRLERLLYVLPLAARADGARIDDLARALDVEPATILSDLEEAMTRDFYQPAGSVDSFNLSVEDDVVRLYGREFNRPVRLSAAEAMALGLGLRVLAAEADVDRRAQILAVAHRLESELVAPLIELQPLSRMAEPTIASAMLPAEQPVTVSFGEDDFRGAISEAIEQRRYVDVVYLKANASEPAKRRVAPLRLLYTNGHWYMSAIDDESGQRRMYRVDRILDLHTTSHEHEYDDADAGQRTFTTDGGQPVTVRYSPLVAKWVAERENAQCEADGTLVLTHEVVDMNWLVRHVLQYAGEAVVETAGVKGAVARAAARLV
jgi:predicted DNA-binding transcriptional regulator YafY